MVEALEKVLKSKAKERQVEVGKEKVVQKSAKAPIDTRKKVVSAVGISYDTLAKVKVVVG